MVPSLMVCTSLRSVDKQSTIKGNYFDREWVLDQLKHVHSQKAKLELNKTQTEIQGFNSICL